MPTTTKKTAKKSTTKKSTAKKSTKGAKDSGKAPAKKKGGGRKKYNDLSPNDIKVMRCLRDAGKPVTRAYMQEVTGIQKGYAALLGSPTKEIKPDTLEGRKLVKSEKHEAQGEGDNKTPAGFYYHITKSGASALAKAEKEMEAEAEKAESEE